MLRRSGARVDVIAAPDSRSRVDEAAEHRIVRGSCPGQAGSKTTRGHETGSSPYPYLPRRAKDRRIVLKPIPNLNAPRFNKCQ